MSRHRALMGQINIHQESMDQIDDAMMAAANNLAMDPTNEAHSREVRLLTAQKAEAEASIAALRMAMTAAQAYDASDVARERAEQRRQAFIEIGEAGDRMQRAAGKVDAAFAALEKSVAALTAERKAMIEATRRFLKLADLTVDDRFHLGLRAESPPSLLPYSLCDGLFRVGNAMDMEPARRDYVSWNTFNLGGQHRPATVEEGAIANVQRVMDVIALIEEKQVQAGGDEDSHVLQHA